MKTKVKILLWPNDENEPTAEIYMENPPTIPAIGDQIVFDAVEGPVLMGRITHRTFSNLVYMFEVDLWAEPIDTIHNRFISN